jgi:hypothetical protein
MKNETSLDLLANEIRSLLLDQSALMSEFRAQYPELRDWDHLLDWPKKGFITIRQSKWAFNRHGLGIRFEMENSGTVVDIHRRVLDVAHFDDWRLLLYLHSRGHHISSSQLGSALERLETDGRIFRLGDEMFAIQAVDNP